MNIIVELIHNRNMTAYFTRKDYERKFNEYSELCKPFFDSLPSNPSDFDITACEGFDALNECWNSQRFFRKSAVRDNDRLMFVTFFSPAARIHSEAAFDFSEKIRARWLQAYPDEPFETADFETIMNGFKRTTMLGFKIK